MPNHKRVLQHRLAKKRITAKSIVLARPPPAGIPIDDVVGRVRSSLERGKEKKTLFSVETPVTKFRGNERSKGSSCWYTYR